MRHNGVLAALTALHPLTDLVSSALFVYVAEDPWAVVLYNAIAFALQLPLGFLLDHVAFALWKSLVVAWSLLGCGCAIYAVTGESVPSIAVACLGNALFHIAAGRHVLAEDGGRSGHVGVFISTGAFGLLLGMRYGTTFPFLTIVLPLLPFALLAAVVWWLDGHCLYKGAEDGRGGSWTWKEGAILALLGALVIWRSHGVLTVTKTFSSMHPGFVLVFMLALVSCLGQAVGGYLSNRFGRLRIIVLSLVGSAVLFWIFPAHWTIGCLALMFVAQLATGPVVSCLYWITSSRAGLAFGINCMALFVSTLVGHCPRGFFWFLAGEWLTLALEYAATAWVRLPRWFWAVMTVNLVTHPALTYVVSRMGLTLPVVVGGELSVVLIEGAILTVIYHRHCSWWKMLAVSLWMNSISYFTYELLKNHG